MQLSDYLRQTFLQPDQLLTRVNQSIAAHDMPQISVSPEVGQLLTLLVKISGSKSLLEIGALAGYSGICLLRGAASTAEQGTQVPPGDGARPAIGHLTSLELNPDFARVAQANLNVAGYGSQVTYLVGPAVDSLKRLEAGQASFDFILIDADKGNYTEYLNRSIRLSHPGTLIVADNVLREGRVLDESDQAPSTLAIRAFNARLGQNERVESILVPIGDGVAVARVR